MTSKRETGQRVERPSCPDLDAILGLEYKVLDDGFIRVVDYMGTEDSVVQAARVSYGKGTKKVHEDVGLIRHLMRHRHSTPNEMCELKIHVRVPMDCWRQWIRHRTASVNEYSTRYSEAIDDKQRTGAGEWREQSVTNRQGSGGFLDREVGEQLSMEEAKFHQHASSVYQKRLDDGVAREQARKDLPLSSYTEAYWKIDLHNLLHFLALRMDSHAQKEIRDYATILGEQVVAIWLPNIWKAFQEYRLNAMILTERDIRMIHQILTREGGQPSALAAEWGWDKEKNRERKEFEEKIQKLGVPSPW